MLAMSRAAQSSRSSSAETCSAYEYSELLLEASEAFGVRRYSWVDWFVASIFGSVVAWPAVFATDTLWAEVLLPRALGGHVAREDLLVIEGYSHSSGAYEVSLACPSVETHDGECGAHATALGGACSGALGCGDSIARDTTGATARDVARRSGSQ